jgi:DNA-binding response OmpR family regulator
MKKRILSLSGNPELGKLRAMVLRQAGYEVLWPSSKDDAERTIRDENFDVLLLGHTVSGDTARELAEAFRIKNPNGKIIAVMATNYVKVRPDRTVKAIDGPEALLEAIEELVGR